MIVPLLFFEKTYIKQWLVILYNFICRAFCMNGHRASCILRYWAMTNGIVRHRCLGYKTLQIPRVQPRNGWRIFLQGIQEWSYTA